MTLPERPELPAGVPASAPPAPAPWPPPAAPEPAEDGHGDDALARVPLWAPMIPMVLIGLLIWAAYAAPDDGDGAIGELDATALVVGLLVQSAFLLGIAIAFTLGKAGHPVFARLGLRRLLAWPGLWKAAVAYVSFWIATAIFTVAAAPDDEQQDLVQQLEDETDVGVLVTLAVLTTILAPLIEETFFRGFLFGVLRSRMPLAPAAVIGGVLFGLVHLPAPAAAAVVLSGFGITLCLLYHWTGSLIPCLGLHAVHNAITFSVTKGLPLWGSIALILASCTIVVSVGLLLARLSSPPSPSPAR